MAERRLYEGDDNGMGYPILSRHATRQGLAREDDVPVAPRWPCGIPECVEGVGPATLHLGLCSVHAPLLPFDWQGIRHRLQLEFKHGARQQPEAWRAALAEAVAFIQVQGGDRG